MKFSSNHSWSISNQRLDLADCPGKFFFVLLLFFFIMWILSVYHHHLCIQPLFNIHLFSKLLWLQMDPLLPSPWQQRRLPTLTAASHRPHHTPPPDSPSRELILSRSPPPEETFGAEKLPRHHFPVIHRRLPWTPTMVRYVILQRYLREIPPQISFRNTRISAWFTPQKGHLRGVKLLSPEDWSPAPKSIQLDDDASTIASEEIYPDFGVDDGNVDWQDDDDDPADAPGRAHSHSLTGTTSQSPPPPTQYWTHRTGTAASQWYLPAHVCSF